MNKRPVTAPRTGSLSSLQALVPALLARACLAHGHGPPVTQSGHGLPVTLTESGHGCGHQPEFVHSTTRSGCPTKTPRIFPPSRLPPDPTSNQRWGPRRLNPKQSVVLARRTLLSFASRADSARFSAPPVR